MKHKKGENPRPDYAMTLEEIGEELGLTRSAICNIEAEALAKLRKLPRRDLLESELSSLAHHPALLKGGSEPALFHSVDEYWPEFLLK